MADRQYPAFRTTKAVDVRFAPQIGTLSCGYHHIVRAFGQPTFSVDNNDTFEGTEQCAWQIQFQNGSAVVLSENKGFGSGDSHYEKSNSWKVNSRDEKTIQWIKQAIRDANPNG
jgi:hypothetical protein